MFSPVNIWFSNVIMISILFLKLKRNENLIVIQSNEINKRLTRKIIIVRIFVLKERGTIETSKLWNKCLWIRLREKLVEKSLSLLFVCCEKRTDEMAPFVFHTKTFHLS